MNQLCNPNNQIIKYFKSSKKKKPTIFCNLKYFLNGCYYSGVKCRGCSDYLVPKAHVFQSKNGDAMKGSKHK